MSEKDPHQVKAMEFPDFSREKGPASYRVIKAKTGALTKFDPDYRAPKQADVRFDLDSGARKALALEAEERSMLQKRIQSEVERVRQGAQTAGHDAGYAAGLKEGATKAFNEFRTDGESKLKRIESFVQEIEALKHDLFKANERFIIELAFQISKAVCLKELQTDSEYLQRLAVELVEKSGARGQIRIAISPRDAGAVEAVRESVLKQFATLENLRIEVDEGVHSGVVLETEWSQIEASLETQLKHFKDALVAGVSSDIAQAGEGWTKSS
jgi:flagellar biosynthesis/type III secretory pathway protein FliH